MAATLKAKRNDTFSLDCTRTDAAGDPVSLSGVTIAAHLTYGAVTVELVSAVVDAAAGTFSLTKPAADMDIAVGIYSCDVQFTDGASVRSTETFFVNLETDITT